MKIAIIGHGFVGKAVDNAFTVNCEKEIVDPIYGNSIKTMKFEPEIAFVCVPTPMNNDGSVNSSILENVVKELFDVCPNTLVVVKSTITPDVITNLLNIKPFVYNPEFLTEANANEDFINPHAVILGGNDIDCSLVKTAYLNHSIVNKEVRFIMLDIIDSVFVKYATNTFLASKVVFFNQLKQLFDKSNGSNWNDMINALSFDKRIGHSHMKVPGPDGKLGFGGACFPKDTKALVCYAETMGIDLTVLSKIINTNDDIRKQYDVSDREKVQNIKF